ncbi:MAG: serpin family protein [Chthoniobacterales bacterium]
MKRLVPVAAALAALASPAGGATFDAAAQATNQFGLDLYRQIVSTEENLCISPYSISCALAMTMDGADGATRTEMAQVLRLDPHGESDASFAALQESLGKIGPATAALVAQSKTAGGSSEPVRIAVANRLFAQEGFEFRPQFFAEVKENFGAVPELVDFRSNGAAATKKINDWVAQQTRDRIRDLIPQALDPTTRLVLANALYLKAPWATPFPARATEPEPFHVHGKAAIDVPMMQQKAHFRYAKHDGFTAVALPYFGGDLQFVVLVPDTIDGLAGLEAKLTAAMIADCARMNETEIVLHLPKFKFEPPTLPLTKPLQALGMKTAFDIPPGSADFDRMAPRKPNDYLAISDVFHKTFIAVDENGTEAAAATAVAMRALTALARPEQPLEVKVDRPFLYAIQHVPSGACLFIGRVTDPR